MLHIKGRRRIRRRRKVRRRLKPGSSQSERAGRSVTLSGRVFEVKIFGADGWVVMSTPPLG
eukprot:2633904-Pyramimonas_sp.AAC.1